jgi:hypothetical protein
MKENEHLLIKGKLLVRFKVIKALKMNFHHTF